MHELHNNIKTVRAIEPKAVGTTGSSNGSLSGIIDRLGYRAVEFIYGYGTIPSTTETITPVVLESDTTGGSFTSVADADLVGTEADAAIAATTTTRVSGTSKNVFKKVGYKGTKRYLKTRVYGVGTATAIVSAVAVLHSPRHAPAA